MKERGEKKKKRRSNDDNTVTMMMMRRGEKQQGGAIGRKESGKRPSGSRHREGCRVFRRGKRPVYLEGDDFRVAERPAAERRHRPL